MSPARTPPPPPPPPRLNRSALAVPGNNAKFIDRAPQSAADVIFFDLEDSVPVDQKEVARRTVIAAINDLDFRGKTVSVRINALDTPFMYRDVIDIVETVGARLDLILVPKVGCAADVIVLDVLLSQIEAAKGLSKRIGLELLIETAAGVQNLDEIAAASSRTETLLFGSGDFAASTGARSPGIGLPVPDYHVLTAAPPDRPDQRARHWGDIWHYVMVRMVIAARANGLRPVDGPFADVKDAEGCEAAMKRAAALGFEGKMVIHPSQIDLANRVFSPSKDEIAHARRVLAALDDAKKEGRAAVVLDGRMIDIASIRQAEATVKKAELVGA